MNGKQFIKKIRNHAKYDLKTIVLPESIDDRIIKATIEITKKRLAKIILIGNEEIITNSIKKHCRLNSIFKLITIINPSTYPEKKKYEEQLFNIRKKKGMTKPQARKLIQNPNYFGTMLLYNGIAQGLVSGADNPTSATFKPALQIIKTKKDIHTASSFFFMGLKHQVIIFADCAFNIQPDVDQLTEIAITTNDSAIAFDLNPKIAMLSFSSHGSAHHADAKKVIEATKQIKKKRKDIFIDGELQFDAAFVPAIAKKKAPSSNVAGYANIFIFPDLNSGNIGYKIAERIGGAQAIGPISQGFNMPVNDLSRGCSVDDIVNITCITSIQAGMKK